MATPTIEWIGKRVRLSADLRDASGDPHLQAGKEGLVLSQAENGSLVVDCEGSHAVVKPVDLVEITTGGWEGIHTTSTMIKKVKVRDIQPSPFNPRQHYPEAEMSKLAASIREVGVMQPVLLRPITMPLDEATITHYELVFGHRRFRGAQLAGLAEVPAMVRKLTDLQSAQLQAVENLQREDLDAIEEAQGFAAYIEAHSITKDQLAVQLGISRTLVYNRLKLATLGPAAAAAYREKKIGAEVATLIARIDGEKNQAKALQVALDTESSMGAKRSFRRIREDLVTAFATELKDAKWDLGDETLLPIAGPCSTCPKRSGVTPELYGDIAQPAPNNRDFYSYAPKGENVCTDIDCFAAKKTAHLQREQVELEAKGKVVIAGAKARAALDSYGKVKGAYISLADAKGELTKARQAAQKDAKIVPPQVFTVQDPRTGKTVEVLKRAELKAAGVAVKEKPKQATWQQEQAKREAQYAKEREKSRAALATHLRIFEASREAAAGASLDVWWLQRVALLTFAGMSHYSREILATRADCKTPEALEKRVGSMGEPELRTLLLDCVMLDGVHAQYNPDPSNLLAAAKHLGVNISAVIAEAPAEPLAQGVKESAAKAAKAKKTTKAGASTPAAVGSAKAAVPHADVPATAAAASDGGPWPFPGAEPGSPAAALNAAMGEAA